MHIGIGVYPESQRVTPTEAAGLSGANGWSAKANGCVVAAARLRCHNGAPFYQ